MAQGVATETYLKTLAESIGGELDEAARAALESPYPSPEETLRDVYFEAE